MRPDLLEKIFQNLGTPLDLDNAKEKAKMFYKCVQDAKIDLDKDYWIQIASNWDLSICEWDGKQELALYPVYKKNGYFETDTNQIFPIDL
jgi:hypothetical protein